MSAIVASSQSGTKVYHVTAGKTAAEWLALKEKKDLKHDAGVGSLVHCVIHS